MSKKYSKSDLESMKEILFHEMCATDKFCPDCPWVGYTCPRNLVDEEIAHEYEKRFGRYNSGGIRRC